ncbi:hypothetical protein [Stygiolobus caldivivus]|uniref:Thioredoxin n=1 Tax=Stygiolobus caldivivus TaxID=2824673 RepID=A0A8D5ZH28_9CREN|nr:hypothetical protein [Stygiolobus caldivivus]BCU69329.1 hypothetical protein KN1_06260 [Stygiolobus caldivivus]
MISEKIIADAKFYNKLLAIFFTSEKCDICDELFEKVNKLQIAQKFYLLKLNAVEYLQYSVRFSRGIIPSIGIVSPDGRLLGIIESENLDYIEDRLRDIYSDKDKIVGISPPTPQETIEVNPADFYDIVTYALDGNPLDFRGVEFLKFYSKIHKEYGKVLALTKPAEPLAEFLLTGKKPNLDETYTSNLALNIILEIERDESVKKLLDRIKEDGSVVRSSRNEVKGLLIDQAMVGNALVKLYQDSFDEKYLDLALKVYNWTSSNLSDKLGFRDCKPENELTRAPVYEPLANSEASIFFAKLWAITNDQKYLEDAKKAMNVSYTLGSDIRVLSRVAIAYLKINELVRSTVKVKDDIRVEVVKDNGCSNSEYKYSNSCYKSLEEIKTSI